MEIKELEFKNIIAYLIPGVIGLYAISRHSSTIANLFGGGKSVPEATSILLIVLLSIGVGIIFNAITWAIIRPIIECVGDKRPVLDYSKLNKENMEAFKVIIDENFRYYQAYSNMFTSIMIYLLSYIYKNAILRVDIISVSILACIFLFFASRDSLNRSYRNMRLLLKHGEEVLNNDKRNPSA